MVFIETPAFTRQVAELLTDDAYGQFQQFLAAHPQMGDVIRGTGGLRKVRWSAGNSGKRGGVRVIYYWLSSHHQIRLLMMYPKSRKADMSAAEKAALKKVVEKWNG